MKLLRTTDKKMFALFLLSLSTLILSFCFTLILIDNYNYNNPYINTHYTFVDWVSYFSHLCLVLVLFWTSIELLNSKFEFGWKLNFTRIISVSWVVLAGIAFLPTWFYLVVKNLMVLFSEKGFSGWSDKNLVSQNLYAFLDITQTTLTHVIIPVVSFGIYKKCSETKSSIDKKEYIFIAIVSLITFTGYFFYANLATFLYGAAIPYPFFDWQTYNEWWMIIVMINISICLAIIYVYITLTLMDIQNKHYFNRKNKKEIINE